MYVYYVLSQLYCTVRRRPAGVGPLTARGVIGCDWWPDGHVTVPRRGVGPAALRRQSSPGREAGRVHGHRILGKTEMALQHRANGQQFAS